jgi:hypothetical protein
VTDGAVGEGDACYFASESRSRLFSLNLADQKVLWAMRTGGVRASADTGRILFVGE